MRSTKGASPAFIAGFEPDESNWCNVSRKRVRWRQAYGVIFSHFSGALIFFVSFFYQEKKERSDEKEQASDAKGLFEFRAVPVFRRLQVFYPDTNDK